jgi:hypothetical protein
MEMKKVTKRLFAIGTGALMLGATAMGALGAVDLKDYPAMFVKNGTFNGYLVVGENANAIDNLAMTDIAAGMKYMKAGEASTVTVEGDAWQASTSSNFLELGENIYDVQNYIGVDELAALADGSITNNKGTSNYEQFLYFDVNSATTNVPSFGQDDDENLGLFYVVDSDQLIGRYYLEFSESLQSDWDSTDHWKDIKDEKLTMLGKTYDIVAADNTSNGPKLTLMGGSTKDTLLEGEAKTFTVKGKEYDVKCLYTNTGVAKFSVNGELTDELAVGETDKLADGTIFGLTEVLYQSYAGGVHSATFYIGADKLVLEDSSSLVVGDETYSESPVSISYTISSNVLSIDSITVNMTADDDLYVPVGGKVTAVMDTPESLLGNWDIEFKGLSTEATEEIKLAPYSGDEKYKLYFTSSTGNAINLPLFYTNGSANVYGGEKDGYGLVVNTSSIARHQYFVLNTADADSKDGESKSYVVQYDGRDGTDETDAKVRFTVLGGDSIERSLATDGTFDLRLGGYTFNFVNTSAGTTKNGAIALNDATASAYTTVISGVSQGIQLRTSNNVEITITDTNISNTASTWTVDINVDDTDRMNGLSTAQHVIYTFSAGTTDVDMTPGSTAQTNRMYYWESNPDNDNEILGYDLYGSYGLQVTPDSGSKTFTMTVPDTQREALLFVTSGATSSTSVSDGSWAPVTIVDATKLDSEVADYKAQNLIVVGGPCVNSVAAALMGNPASCAAGFTPGKATVKLFENGANVAMLVAGYTGEDTRLAGKVVANRWKDLKGTEVEVEGTTYTDAKVGAPAPAVTPVTE